MKKHDLCIDGMKGFGACTIAFVWHYQHFAPTDGSPFYTLMPELYQYGGLMPELFFMLSGFGMVMGYEERIRNREISFGDYMTRRIKRLFPTLWVTLFVTALLQVIYKMKAGGTFVYPNFDLYHFILNLLGLQNGILETGWSFDAPSWCISICMFCYFLFYIIVRKFEKQDLPWVYLGMGLAGCALLLSGLNVPILNSLIGRGVSCFFIGAMLTRINLYWRGYSYLGLGFIVISFVLVRIFGGGCLGNAQMVVILGIAPMFILSVIHIRWLRRLFSIRPIVWLGKVSLSIYLWHFPVQCLIKIVDVYFKLEINYSTKQLWILYAASVILIAALYEKIADKDVIANIKKDK